MAAKDQFIVGLDVGSNKTCAVVSQPNKSGKLEVVGFGVAESKGWRKGLIVNLDLAVLAIKKAVEGAEAAASVPIDSAFVGVAGGHIKGVNSRGAVALGKTPKATREVTPDDVLKVIQTAQRVSLPPDRELLHVEPQEYLLDAQNGIRNPVGMVGGRLEADVHLVTVSATAVRNVVAAVNLAGIKVPDSGLVFEPLASALACLTEDERELGVALVEIGGGSTDLIVYCQATVRHTAAIPVGGDHFTNDIAVGLRTPIPEAERMKLKWGERGPENSQESALQVSGVGERPARVVNYSMLSDIIEPRALELLDLLHTELVRAGFDKQLGAGVVLAGGGSKLGGLAALAEQVLGLPVRLGQPRGIGKLGETLADPAFATAVGLVAYGNRLRLLRQSRDRSWVGRMWGALRG